MGVIKKNDISYGGGSSYDDTELRNRIAALEAKLGDYVDTVFSMVDENNNQDNKYILTKPRYTSMFQLPVGAYDANGNLLSSNLVYDTFDEESAADLYNIDLSQLPAGTRGVVLPNAVGYFASADTVIGEEEGEPVGAFINATPNVLDWIVIPSRTISIGEKLFVDSNGDVVPNACKVIYMQRLLDGGMWGLDDQKSIVDTRGQLYWKYDASKTVANMFQLSEGFYDANGNRLSDYELYGECDGKDEGDAPYSYYRFSFPANYNGGQWVVPPMPAEAVGLVVRGDFSPENYLDDDDITNQFPIENTPEGASLQWLVIKEKDSMDGYTNLFVAASVSYPHPEVPNVVKNKIYYKGDTTNAPWNQQGVTIDAEGRLPWLN